MQLPNDSIARVLDVSNRLLILFARAPSAPGKTRLTAHLPDEQARALREALLLDTLDCARAVGLPLVVAFTPEAARDEMSALVTDASLTAQRGLDVGDRMRHAMDDAFADGAEAVALVGSDLPTLPSDYVTDALTMLIDSDLVLGPTDDGGFYLIAARRALPPLFNEVDWSTATVLQTVVNAAVNTGLTVGVTRPWFDIDTPDDLRRVMRDANPKAAVRTRRAWQEFA